MKISSLRYFINIMALSLSILFLTAPVQAADKISEQEAYQIGIEAYQYLYPLITMDITRKTMTNVPAGKKPGAGPMNTFHHFDSFPDAEFREVVRPNFDTLYSLAWLDLTKEPVVVSMPDTQGRHYLLPMLDMWSDVFAVPGKRTSGTSARDIAIIPKDWKGTLPNGIERIDAPTPYVWVLGRTQTNGPEDYDTVHKIQEGFKVTLLSQWGKPSIEGKVFIDSSVDMNTAPLTQVNTMSAAKYFSYGSELMKLHVPHITDWSTIARLKRIGIEPGKTFVFDKASPEVQAGLNRAVVEGLKQMQNKIPTLAHTVNGWQMLTDSMGVYGNYYLRRAVIAMIGLGANQPEDAIYPLNVGDADGKPLNGKSNYVIHFEKNELPPVNAFWSITMYDVEGFQVANPINRYAIGDRDSLKYNADGSLDIYIQNESPAKDKISNWLPSPKKGTLGVTMRLYAPKTEALDGRWVPPVVTNVK